MRAMDLYAQLESDFITRDMTDTWAKYMGELEEYLQRGLLQSEIWIPVKKK